MKAFTSILVSLLMFSFAGYAVWFTYNQILLDQEQMAKDSQETQRLLKESREYRANLAPKIEALEKDVKQLQDELTASFGSSFSDTPITRRTTYSQRKESTSEGYNITSSKKGESCLEKYKKHQDYNLYLFCVRKENGVFNK